MRIKLNTQKISVNPINFVDQLVGFSSRSAPNEGPQSVAEAKCLRVLALINDTSLGVKQAYTNSLRG